MYLSIILAFLCVLHSIQANCPHGWTSWRDSCYIMLKDKLVWDEASRVCGQRPQSFLAVPNSVEENDVIHRMQREACVVGETSCGLWIGCKTDLNLKLTCVDRLQGSSFKYWVEHFSQYTGRHNNCVFLSKVNGGRWQSDVVCDHARFTVCEMPRRIKLYSFTMSADGRVQHRCLHGHEIKKVSVNGLIECGEACWAEPQCRSFNLRRGGGASKICQLNNATIGESGGDDVSSDKMCNYFGLWNSRYQFNSALKWFSQLSYNKGHCVEL